MSERTCGKCPRWKDTDPCEKNPGQRYCRMKESIVWIESADATECEIRTAQREAEEEIGVAEVLIARLNSDIRSNNIKYGQVLKVVRDAAQNMLEWLEENLLALDIAGGEKVIALSQTVTKINSILGDSGKGN